MQIITFPHWRLLAVAFAALCLTSCPGGENLPPDPGLAADPLGLNISIGNGESAARSAASVVSGEDVQVMSPEELLTHNPYAERVVGKDLVVVVIVETGAKLGARNVGELRAYLAGAEQSHLNLLGRKAASLSTEDAMKLLGKPLSASTGSDGISHLEWRFDGGGRKSPPLGAVLSFGQSGTCFAVEIKRLVSL